MRLRSTRLILAGFGLFLATACDAWADLSISISEDGKTAYSTSTSLTMLTLNSGTGGMQLSTAAPDYNFSGLTLTATTGAPQGNITLTGTIGTTSNTLHTLTILVSENMFTASGTNYSMASTSSYSFNGGGGPDSTSAYSFQSYATPGQVQFGTTTMSPGHSYGGTANGGLGYPLGSGSYNESATQFTSTIGYSLTEKYIFTSSVSGETFQPTGSTTVTPTSVPEPASVVLLALGAGSFGLIAARRRSRRRTARPESRANDGRDI